MIDRIRKLLGDREKIREIILYVVFGALTTAVNWLVYVVMTGAMRMDGYEAGSASQLLIGNASNVTAWILSVLFAFFTNKTFVFRSRATAKTGAVREFMLFVSARLMSYLLFDLLLYSLLFFVMDDKIDKLFMNVLVVLFNYLASRFVIFKKKNAGEDAK